MPQCSAVRQLKGGPGKDKYVADRQRIAAVAPRQGMWFRFVPGPETAMRYDTRSPVGGTAGRATSPVLSSDVSAQFVITEYPPKRGGDPRKSTFASASVWFM